jgi:hypothetical protein
MVVDDDILEKEDMYILDRMKAFVSGEEVNCFAAAKQLVASIERTVGPPLISVSVKFLSLLSNSNAEPIP